MKKSLLLLFGLATLLATAIEVTALPQEAVPEEERAGYEFRNEEEIRAALEEVLGDGEFRILERAREKPEEPESKEKKESDAPGWLKRLINWLIDKLTPDSEQVLPEQQTRTSPWVLAAMKTIQYGLAAIALLLVVVVIVKAILKRAPKESLLSAQVKAAQVETASPPGEVPSDEYVTRAVTLADSGNYKDAVRQLLLGTMSWIERHGLIRYRRGLSNRDYLRALSDRSGQQESLRPIVLHFEQVYFGRREATAGGFQECLKHFRKAFSTD